MRKIFLLFICSAAILISCDSNTPDPRSIMMETMKSHGTDLAAKGQLDFTFRGIDYSTSREGGNFNYERHLMIGADTILDRLNNSGFYRYSNDAKINLPDSLTQRYSASLNSVIYFAQLPYSLDGDAINLKYIGQDSIKGKAYHEIEVTFNAEGGGEDHEDVFVYWINQKDHLIDYLAYSYCEEECGYRFRESVNRRNINGVIIQDYNNYKSSKTDPDLSKMDDLFDADQLDLLSKIKLERASFKANK